MSKDQNVPSYVVNMWWNLRFHGWIQGSMVELQGYLPLHQAPLTLTAASALCAVALRQRRRAVKRCTMRKAQPASDSVRDRSTTPPVDRSTNRTKQNGPFVTIVINGGKLINVYKWRNMNGKLVIYPYTYMGFIAPFMTGRGSTCRHCSGKIFITHWQFQETIS